MELLLAGVMGLALLLAPAAIVGMVLLHRLRGLERRLERVEREGRPGGSAPSVAASAASPVAPSPAAPPNVAAALAAPHVAAPARAIASPPSLAPPALPASAPARAAEHGAPDLDRFEQLVGGVWMQNAGALVVLVGVFLMIVWGYGSGRFGPGVLVAAGVALGLLMTWRGDVVTRTLPGFGRALIGLGLGAVYTTLYLGFARLHVFGPQVALPLLALVSVGAITLALRHRVQLVGVLGVAGAFLPQFLAGWLHVGTFRLEPWTLLGWLAVVDVLVFALAARAGWSALDLTALALSALAWIAGNPGRVWDWPQQIALALLFTALGLAPLPRLCGAEGRVRARDLAVIAAAPLMLLVASLPFLAWARADLVAVLLLALAAVTLGAAWWTDQRRPERDLWAPLTGAATLYVTAAAARALDASLVPIAWSAEGLLLLALGLAPRAGALRVWGAVVLLLGGARTVALLGDAGAWDAAAPAFGDPRRLLALGGTLAVLAASGTLARGRSRLLPLERRMPELWGAAGNAMLFAWLWIVAGQLACSLVLPAPGSHAMPPPVGTSVSERRDELSQALRSAAWMAQGGALAWLGARRGGGFLRAAAACAGAGSLFVLWLWMGSNGWGYDHSPALNAGTLTELAVVVIAFAIAARLASWPGRREGFDAQGAEMWAAGAAISLAWWCSHVGGHFARSLVGYAASSDPFEAAAASRRLPALAAAITSAGWIAEAAGLLVTGWWRGSAFLRWSALALLGVTLLKFLLLDLVNVDVFWRFLVALAVGVAMLTISWAYQRRQRARSREA